MIPVTPFRILIGIFALLAPWSAGAAPSGAGSGPLVLMPGEHHRTLDQHIQFVRDATGNLSLPDILAGRAGPFRSLPGPKIDLGFTKDTIWLKLPVLNGGDRPGSWYLTTNENFMHLLDVWLVQDGEAQRIISESDEKPFSERRISYRHVTGTFDLAAGKQADILIGYQSGGSSSLRLTIETQSSFFDRQAYELVKNTIYYTATFMLIVFSLAMIPVFRQWVQLAFAAYLAWVAFYVAQMDGYTLQFLWPDRPQWNAYASLPLGYGIAIFGAIFAREFLGTRTDNRRMDLVFQGMIWITAAILLVSPFADIQFLKKMGFPYISFLTLVCFVCSIVALRYKRPGTGFFITGWLAVIASGIYSTFAHWKPGALPVDASFDTIRIGMLFQGTMFGLAMAEHLLFFRRERDAALRREMKALEENVALERSHAYAQALADARRAQLASASHDLKQPLVSLRLMLRRAIGPQDTAVVTSMRRSIDYLEKLVRRYLDDTDATTETAPERRHSGVDANNRFDLALILGNVASMFADEAQARGGRLRLAPCSAEVCADPMAVMRIISNFVSNAVKHSREGNVLVGCRRQGDRLRIEIHDQGPGLDDDRLVRLRHAYQSGQALETGKNDGLGLMIALKMIVENGFGFDVETRKGRGTVFALILPRS